MKPYDYPHALIDRLFRDIDWWMTWAHRFEIELRYAVGPKSPLIQEFEGADQRRKLARRLWLKSITEGLRLPGNGFTIWTR